MKKILCFVVFLLFISSQGFSKKVGDYSIENSMQAGSDTLVLNGAGLRTKRVVFNVDVYVSGLYLKEKCSDAGKIIDLNENMAIKLKIVTSLITSKNFIEQTTEGFRKATNGNTAPIQNSINKFINVFADGVDKGDVYDIVFIKGTGVRVYKNKKNMITINDFKLKKALFAIWIGKLPIQQELKKSMLGI